MILNYVEQLLRLNKGRLVMVKDFRADAPFKGYEIPVQLMFESGWKYCASMPTFVPFTIGNVRKFSFSLEDCTPLFELNTQWVVASYVHDDPEDLQDCGHFWVRAELQDIYDEKVTLQKHLTFSCPTCGKRLQNKRVYVIQCSYCAEDTLEEDGNVLVGKMPIISPE